MNPGLALLTFFPSRVGGTETYLRGLLRAFSEGTGPNSATLLTSNLSDSFARGFCSRNLTCVRLPSYNSGTSDIARLIAMQRARLRGASLAAEIPEAVDLIHYPVTVPLPPNRNLPSVVTLADVQHHDLKDMFSRAERLYRRWAYDQAAHQSDAVITISRFSKERLVAHLGLPEERIHVIHHGVDHNVFNPVEQAGGGMSSLDLPDRYFVYPAAGWRHKNHAALLDAFRSLHAPDVFLVLTGGERHALPNLDDPRVIHAGMVSTEELASLYRGALAMVMPTLYEGFGLPALEAMACGTPVAVSDLPSLREICGNAALTLDPYDTNSLTEAMEALANDGALRERLSGEGLQRAAQFTWERAAAEHARVYETVVS